MTRRVLACLFAFAVLFALLAAPTAADAKRSCGGTTFTRSNSQAFTRVVLPNAHAYVSAQAIEAPDCSGWWIQNVRVHTDGDAPNLCDDDGFENDPALETGWLKLFTGGGVVKYQTLSPNIAAYNSCDYVWTFSGPTCGCIKIGTPNAEVRYAYRARVNGGADVDGLMSLNFP